MSASPRATEPSFVHGDWVQVYIDPDPSGRGPGFVRIEERYGAVGAAILPIWGTKIGLVRVFRRTADEMMLEIPRGFGGESSGTRGDAARELWEETGILVDRSDLIELGFVRANTGILGSKVAVFAAIVEKFVPVEVPDAEEVSGFEWFEFEDVLSMVATSELVDAFTCTAILKAVSRKLVLPTL